MSLKEGYQWIPSKPRRISRWLSRILMILSLMMFIPLALTSILGTHYQFLFNYHKGFQDYFIILWGLSLLFLVFSMFFTYSDKKWVYVGTSITSLVLISTAIFLMESELTMNLTQAYTSPDYIVQLAFTILIALPIPTILLSILIATRKVRAWISYLFYPFLIILAIIGLYAFALNISAVLSASARDISEKLNNLAGSTFLLSVSIYASSMLFFLYSLPRFEKMKIEGDDPATANEGSESVQAGRSKRRISGSIIGLLIVCVILVSYTITYLTVGIYGTYKSLYGDPETNKIIFLFSPLIFIGNCQYVTAYSTQYTPFIIDGNGIRIFNSPIYRHGRYLMGARNWLTGQLPNGSKISGNLQYSYQLNGKEVSYLLEFKNDGTMTETNKENGDVAYSGAYVRKDDVITIKDSTKNYTLVLVKYHGYYYIAQYEK